MLVVFVGNEQSRIATCLHIDKMRPVVRHGSGWDLDQERNDTDSTEIKCLRQLERRRQTTGICLSTFAMKTVWIMSLRQLITAFNMGKIKTFAERIPVKISKMMVQMI